MGNVGQKFNGYLNVWKKMSTFDKINFQQELREQYQYPRTKLAQEPREQTDRSKMTSKNVEAEAMAALEPQITYRKYDPRNPDNNVPSDVREQVKSWSREKLEFQFMKQLIRANHKKEEAAGLCLKLRETRAKLVTQSEATLALTDEAALKEEKLAIASMLHYSLLTAAKKSRDLQKALDQALTLDQHLQCPNTPPVAKRPGAKLEAPGAPKKERISLVFDSESDEA